MMGHRTFEYAGKIVTGSRRTIAEVIRDKQKNARYQVFGPDGTWVTGTNEYTKAVEAMPGGGYITDNGARS
jgi:hypothetical protein